MNGDTQTKIATSADSQEKQLAATTQRCGWAFIAMDNRKLPQFQISHPKTNNLQPNYPSILKPAI
jgi:hypothetical protein